MKKTRDREAKIAYKIGQSWGQQIMAVTIGMLLTMIIVWVTMPSEDQRLINRQCFAACKIKIEKEGYSMSFFSGPAYVDAIKECHAECASAIK